MYECRVIVAGRANLKTLLLLPLFFSSASPIRTSYDTRFFSAASASAARVHSRSRFTPASRTPFPTRLRRSSRSFPGAFVQLSVLSAAVAPLHEPVAQLLYLAAYRGGARQARFKIGQEACCEHLNALELVMGGSRAQLGNAEVDPSLTDLQKSILMAPYRRILTFITVLRCPRWLQVSCTRGQGGRRYPS